MHGADVVVVEQSGLFLGQDHDAPRGLGEPLEHGISPSVVGGRGDIVSRYVASPAREQERVYAKRPIGNHGTVPDGTLISLWPGAAAAGAPEGARPESWQTGGMSMTNPVTAAGSGTGRRRAVRAAQAGRDLPQGAEQAAVRAAAAHQHPRGGAGHRGARRTRRARGGHRAAGRGEGRPTRDAAARAAAIDRLAARVADVPGIVRVCRALRVDKTPEAAIAAAIALTGRAAARSLCGHGAGTSASPSRPSSSTR